MSEALDRELARLWLVAERCYRQLVAAGLRGKPSKELEAVLAARAASRDGADDAATLDRLCAQADAEIGAQRPGTALGRLGERLGLSALEIELLAIALAPHVDPPLAELFHAIRGTTKRGASIGLVTQLLRLGRAQRTALLGALDPERPLLAWRLLEAAPGDASDASAANRALHPTFGAVELLAGGGQPSSQIVRFARIRRGAATLDDLIFSHAARTTAQRLCRAGTGECGPWTVLWGLTGAGKKLLATRMAAHVGQPLLTFDLMAVDRAQRAALLRIAQRDALALGAVLYVGPLPPTGDDVTALLRPLATHPGRVVLGVETSRPPRLGLDVPVREVEVAIPDETTRLALWRAQLGDAFGDGLPALARSFHLTPGEIVDTVAEAKLVARAEARQVAFADVRAGVERRLRNGLQDFAWRVDVGVAWNDLVLAPEDRGRVEEFIARRVFASKVYGEWGFGKRIERGRGAIALFSGPPGTGKTMLAGLIAKGLGLDLYQVDLSQIQSRYVGETEKSLGRVFDLAERAHAVLLFDEADSLLSKRTDPDSSNDRYANAHVNYLLQRLEAYSGVVVLTTNKDAALDEALQRRLTLHLRLDVPEVRERERLWQSFLPASMPREHDLDLSELARDFELTGGYIKNVVVRAAFLAAREQRVLGTALLRRAATLELEDMGRVVHAR